MKTIIKAAIVAVGLFSITNSNAQVVKKVGHKTSQIAASGAAAITDKRYKGKYGPHGELIYINKHSQYFYVNKKGHRVYVTKAHLRNYKPKDRD